MNRHGLHCCQKTNQVHNYKTYLQLEQIWMHYKRVSCYIYAQYSLWRETETWSRLDFEHHTSKPLQFVSIVENIMVIRFDTNVNEFLLLDCFWMKLEYQCKLKRGEPFSQICLVVCSVASYWFVKMINDRTSLKFSTSLSWNQRDPLENHLHARHV